MGKKYDNQQKNAKMGPDSMPPPPPPHTHTPSVSVHWDICFCVKNKSS